MNQDIPLFVEEFKNFYNKYVSNGFEPFDTNTVQKIILYLMDNNSASINAVAGLIREDCYNLLDEPNTYLFEMFSEMMSDAYLDERFELRFLDSFFETYIVYYFHESLDSGFNLLLKNVLNSF